MGHPCTKALLQKIEIDLDELQMQWTLGNFDSHEEARASGQAFYLLALPEEIRHMLAEVEQNKDV